jgi:hypothetical protein
MGVATMMTVNPNVAAFSAKLLGVKISMAILVDQDTKKADCHVQLSGSVDASYKYTLNPGDSVGLFSTDNADLDQITLLPDGNVYVPTRFVKYELK